VVYTTRVQKGHPGKILSNGIEVEAKHSGIGIVLDYQWILPLETIKHWNFFMDKALFVVVHSVRTAAEN